MASCMIQKDRKQTRSKHNAYVDKPYTRKSIIQVSHVHSSLQFFSLHLSPSLPTLNCELDRPDAKRSTPLLGTTSVWMCCSKARNSDDDSRNFMHPKEHSHIKTRNLKLILKVAFYRCTCYLLSIPAVGRAGRRTYRAGYLPQTGQIANDWTQHLHTGWNLVANAWG